MRWFRRKKVLWGLGFLLLLTWAVSKSFGSSMWPPISQGTGILQRKLLEARNAKLAVSEELTRANEQVSDLNRQLEEARKGEAVSAEQLNQAEEKLAHLMNTPLRQDLEVLKKDLKEKQEELNRLGRIVAESKQERGKLEARLEDLEQHLEKREEELLRRKQELKQMQDASRELEKRLAQTQSQHKREVEELQKRLVDRREFDRLQKELQEANNRIADLVVSLDLQEQLASQLAESRDR